MLRPKQIIDAIEFGRKRYVMTDTVVRLTKEWRDENIPGAKTWEAFELALILHRMLEVHQRGREASALDISRAIGMPRTTVLRRLAQLKQMGAVEQHGPRFTVVPAFMNAEHKIEGFKGRRDMWHRTDKKLPDTST